MILLLTFPHSFSSYTLCMLLPHAYYFLFTFLFLSTDFLFFHAQPYCLYIVSCTVCLLMHSPAQSAYSCVAYLGIASLQSIFFLNGSNGGLE